MVWTHRLAWRGAGEFCFSVWGSDDKYILFCKGHGVLFIIAQMQSALILLMSWCKDSRCDSIEYLTIYQWGFVGAMNSWLAQNLTALTQEDG